MTEVNEVCSMGAYLWPRSECFSPLSVLFYSPSHSGCLLVCWLFFPLIVFPGSGESCRDVCVHLCVCVCVSLKYSILALAPALWSLSFFCSSPAVCYKMVEDSSYKRLQYYLPHFWKHGVLACLLFDLTCHNIVVHWVSKQLSKTIFFWRN